MSNVRRHKREKLSQVEGLGSSLNPATVSSVGEAICSLSIAKLRAGNSEPNRTASSIGGARFGTPSRYRAGLGSSTRTAANTTPLWLAKSVSQWVQFGHTASCEHNSNTQSGAPFWFHQFLGRQSKSSGSTSAA